MSKESGYDVSQAFSDIPIVQRQQRRRLLQVSTRSLAINIIQARVLDTPIILNGIQKATRVAAVQSADYFHSTQQNGLVNLNIGCLPVNLAII